MHIPVLNSDNIAIKILIEKYSISPPLHSYYVINAKTLISIIFYNKYIIKFVAIKFVAKDAQI